MAVSWAEVFPHLMRAKLIATRGVKERLLSLNDPISVIKDFESRGIVGPITIEMLPKKSRKILSIWYR